MQFFFALSCLLAALAVSSGASNSEETVRAGVDAQGAVVAASETEVVGKTRVAVETSADNQDTTAAGREKRSFLHRLGCKLGHHHGSKHLGGCGVQGCGGAVGCTQVGGCGVGCGSNGVCGSNTVVVHQNVPVDQPIPVQVPVVKVVHQDVPVPKPVPVPVVKVVHVPVPVVQPKPCCILPQPCCGLPQMPCTSCSG